MRKVKSKEVSRDKIGQIVQNDRIVLLFDILFIEFLRVGDYNMIVDKEEMISTRTRR